MDQLKARIEAVDGGRGKAFADQFINGHPTLAEQAKTNRKAAVRRARQARRCCALLEGLGAETLSAYPEHWLRVLETVQEKLRQAITLLKTIADMPSKAVREEVAESEKMMQFVLSCYEMVRVGRLVLSSAADALLGLVLDEKDGMETLVEEFEVLIKKAGIPYEEEIASTDHHSVPSFEDIRLIIADCPEAISLAIDARSVCNISLIPLAAAKQLGVAVTYYSGAVLFAPCCNLWLNAISLEIPQPEAPIDDSFF